MRQIETVQEGGKQIGSTLSMLGKDKYAGFVDLHPHNPSVKEVNGKTGKVLLIKALNLSQLFEQNLPKWQSISIFFYRQSLSFFHLTHQLNSNSDHLKYTKFLPNQIKSLQRLRSSKYNPTDRLLMSIKMRS